MIKVFRFLFSFFTTVSILFASVFTPAQLAEPTENLDFSVLEYPSEAVLTLEQAGLTAFDLTDRAYADRELYEATKGYDDVNGLVVSPYYTAHIGDVELPVYSAIVFNGESQTGALHSFSEIYIEKGTEFSFNIELKSADMTLKNAIVLPESLGVEAVCKNGTVAASINDFGIYTFLFNNASQEGAFTLFVREEVDEDAEIARLQAEYGEDRVFVYEKGVYYEDYLFGNTDNIVLYLKRGAYLIANNKYEIMSEEDENNCIEPGAWENNSIGLTRFPFISTYNCDNIQVLGGGLLDLSHLDRRERRGLVFTNCNNVLVDGIKIVNAPEWSFITYQCSNVTVRNVDIFGYRMNADAFALCNTQNAVVENCFARTGDDLFDVKALGSSLGMASENITFKNCIAWGGKARCFGICGEVYNPIRNITFKDSAVIVRDATWNNERVASLAIIVENDGGSIENVTFENIEIFRDDGRAIGCIIYGEEIENFNLTGVVYKDISYNAGLQSKIAGNGLANNIEVTFDNVTAYGIDLGMLSGLLVETDGEAQINYAK